MTNHFDAKAEWVDGAWRAMVRYVHKAEHWPVMKDGKPLGFASRAEAELAAHRALTEHINGTIRGDGKMARVDAERLFTARKDPPPVVMRQPGKKPCAVFKGRARV